MRPPQQFAVRKQRKVSIMTSNQKSARELVVLGSARVNTKGGVIGSKDEPLIGGRYNG